MAGDPKVLIGEQDSVDFDFNVEYSLDMLDSPDPQGSQSYTFDGSERPTLIVFYKNTTKIEANRIAQVAVVYDGSDRPTSETWTYYKTSDGTALLKTVTVTYTWSGDLPTSSEVVWT